MEKYVASAVESFGWVYRGLKETPGVTELSLNAGIPLSPAVRSLVPPNEAL